MDYVVNFSDVIKKSILNLEAFEQTSVLEILIGLLVSLLVGLFVFFIYRKVSRSVVYNHSFNVSLVIMCILTASIIMTISSNIVLSLGMVGALSIVRFRTALKDPMDIMFMFWVIAAGIATGAGFYPLAAITTVFVGAVLLMLSSFRFKKNTYLLVVHYTDEASDAVKTRIGRIKHTLKSKTVSKGVTELTLEMMISGDNTMFVNDLSEIQGVKDAVLMNYKGDYAN